MIEHICEQLLEAEEEEPQKIALESGGGPMTYGALAQNVRRMAAGLSAHGVQPGAAVGLMLPNVPQFVEALYGTWLHGSVVVPMNVLLRRAEIGYVARDSALRVLIVHETVLPEVGPALAELSPAPLVFVVGRPGPHQAYAALLADEEWATPPTVAADPHLLTLYTSGTTGKPKGAIITNSNLIAQLDMTDDLFEFLEGDRVLCVLPLFHVFAVNGVLNASIQHRCTVILHPRFEVDATVHSLQHDGIASMAGVPSMFFYILKHPKLATLRFPSLRYCVSGGAAMPVDVMRAFEDRFQVPIYEGYGLTETTVSVCCNREGAKKVGSVGKPFRAVRLKVIDDLGREVPAGQLGEIVVKAPNVMRGYLNRPQETAEAIVDGWFHTGDIGYVDDEGFVFIVDRKKDMIIKSGYNIYPREIEEVLYQLPEVGEAAVVGVADEAKGERIRAVVSLRQGARLTESDIHQHLRTQLAKYKLPSEYVFMPDLPKGPTGKLLKRELRGQLASLQEATSYKPEST